MNIALTIDLRRESRAASLALGLACGYVLIQLLDVLRQALALGGDPIPESLDVGNRGAVDAAIDNAGGGAMGTRAAHLLNAWGAGWDPRSVISLASYQAQQGRQAAYLSAVVPLALLAGAVWQGADATLAVIGFIGTALAVQARLSVNRQGDYYLEQRLLSRLPGNLPTTTMTSEDLASCIGVAIDGTFKDSATALKGALHEHADQMQRSGGSWGGQLQGVLGEHTQQLDKIARLQTDMEKVLHVQEVVDGTLKTVAATQEFKDTIVSLRKHVEESDVLLREVAKPRTIRLVEEDLD